MHETRIMMIVRTADLTVQQEVSYVVDLLYKHS